jgi:hypothetical protein
MKELGYYLERVRAFPGRPILVTAHLEGDQWFWWDLYVVFAPRDGAEPWPEPWFEYQDPVAGRFHVSVKTVERCRFAELLIASPPGDVFVGEGGIHVEHPEGYERDLDGRDQQATKDLGARLSGALGVPFAFEPPDAPSRPWWELAAGIAALN